MFIILVGNIGIAIDIIYFKIFVDHVLAYDR